MMKSVELMNLERYINLISPVALNLYGKTEDELEGIYHATVNAFVDKANEIPAEVWDEQVFDIRDIYEDLVYLCLDDPDCDLSMLANDVIFVANNTEHDNANWMALQAGVPLDDVLA